MVFTSSERGSATGPIRTALTGCLLLAFGLAVSPAAGSSPRESGTEARGEASASLRVAVLPLHRLSSGPVPHLAIERLLRSEMQRLGLRVVPEDILKAFLREHRIRWTGGVDRRTGALFEDELQVDAVLVTSVDDYHEGLPPRVALTSRLVSPGDDPRILWMDAVHRAGNQQPGFLVNGLVDDPLRLTEKAVEELVHSLERHLEGREIRRPPWQAKNRLAPKSHAGSREAIAAAAGSAPRVAVLPFLNESGRTYAGEILALELMRHLAASGTLHVYEPGLVRQASLQIRLIQEDGLSLAQVDTLEALLPLNVVLTGRVSEYRDPLGREDTPEVGFTLRVIDAEDRQAVWSSVSYNRGRDGIVFFDKGRIFTAHELAFEMTRSAVSTMTRWTARQVRRLRQSLGEDTQPPSL